MGSPKNQRKKVVYERKPLVLSQFETKRRMPKTNSEKKQQQHPYIETDFFDMTVKQIRKGEEKKGSVFPAALDAPQAIVFFFTEVWGFGCEKR